MNKLIFHQLFEKETSTYTYLIGDPLTKETIIIDSTIDTVERDFKLLQELSLNLKYILDTHVHADHITGATELKKRTGAKIAQSATSGVQCADVLLKDNDTLAFGTTTIKAIATPGHTNSCMSYYLKDSQPGMVFTGDTLLIRGTGRTDFQQGSSQLLFSSIRQKLFTLPDDTFVYPGHDYLGHTRSTILQEKKFNPRIKLENSESQFIQLMQSLKLDQPKRILESVPANLVCGDLAKIKGSL